MAVLALAAAAERIDPRPGAWRRRAARAERDRWPSDAVRALEQAAARARSGRATCPDTLHRRASPPRRGASGSSFVPP